MKYDDTDGNDYYNFTATFICEDGKEYEEKFICIDEDQVENYLYDLFGDDIKEIVSIKNNGLADRKI